MIEYAHEEKFFQHTSVDFLIVDSGATVTAVSGDAPQVTGATIQITNEMLLKESFSLKESLCSEENLKFGTMEASYCNFTFIGADVPSLEEEEIIIYLYFDGDSSTLFPIGRYIVESDEWTSTSGTLSPRQVSAYDVLAMLEDYDITEWYNEAFSEDTTVSVKDLRDSLFEWLAEEEPDYYIEQAETTLTNDDFMIEKSIESDVITFGFFMRGLMEINGVFGHIDRNGNFKYVLLETYDMSAKSIILNDKRIPPTDYADITVWGIGYVAVYDQDNIRIAKEGSSSKKHPNVYTVVDNFAFSNLNSTAVRLEDIKAAVQNMRDAVYHRRYRPYKMQTAGNLCIEVGDRIDIQYSLDGENNPKTYYTYVLQRSFKGIQSFRDTFEAKGERKQPKYKISNDRWHVGDSQDNSADGTNGIGVVNDTAATNFIKYCRNIGIRLLQEPSVSLEYVRSGESHQVEITWTDPSDITNYKPVPCAWAGTIVVRSESKPPVHPWDDCEILVNSTTRDEYSETPFVDNTIEENKKYYYGIFPYHIALDDAEHPIKYYRFTKVISVNTQRLSLAPLIVSHTVSGSDVTLTIEIPTLDDGSYSYVKAVAKKGSIPASKTDGVVKDVSASATSVTFDGLDDSSHYYFVIFASDGTTEVASDPDDCTTGRNEGYNFAYTGSIQTFTAPKTGIYQLETWGAQGGNASDDNLVARGGYGAYVKGEVLLVQGETLYIGVGGQSGYNGGGTQPQNMLRVMFEGSPTYLAQISDQSIITSEIKNATSFTRIRPSFYDASEQLSYLSSNGDIFYEQNRDLVFSEENTYKLVDNDYIEVGFGKVPYLYNGHQYYGAYVYNKVAQTFGNVYGFERNVGELNWTKKYYVAVVIDYVYKRAYMLFGNDTRNFNYSANGWLCDLYGGVVNGVDYIYESFKDREV